MAYLTVFSPGTFVSRLLGPVMAVLIVAIAQTARADDVKDALDLLMTEQRRMEAYAELDYAQKELVYHQASTILATYSDYNSYNAEGIGDADFGNDLLRLRNRLGGPWPQALASFRRTTGRDKSLSSEDTGLIEDAASLMQDLLAAGAEIAELCEADKAYEASLIYRDRSMPTTAELTRLLYTLSSGANARFKRTALKAKY
jgi:hypothetical protein